MNFVFVVESQAVGSMTSFVEAQQYMGDFVIGDDGINNQLRKYVKTWVSSVFCHKGSESFVKKIQAANKVRCFQRDLVENTAYAIELGFNSVKRLGQYFWMLFVVWFYLHDVGLCVSSGLSI